MYDLIIVGGGPAGLTATVYAIHKRLETLLITEDLGGKANYRMHIRGLEGYETINGEEVVRKFQSQVEYLDFARLMDKAVSVEALRSSDGHEVFQVTTESGTSFVARALVVATGAHPRMLNLTGERRLLGLGISYSAISHPWLEKLRGFDNVVMLEGYAITGVDGSPYLEHMTVRTPDGRQQDIAIKGLFVELGVIPDSGLVQGLVDLDEQGRIVVNCRGETSRPGVYAAGDVTNSYAEQVLIAIGDGAKAVLSAYDYLLRRHQPARSRL